MLLLFCYGTNTGGNTSPAMDIGNINLGAGVDERTLDLTLTVYACSILMLFLLLFFMLMLFLLLFFMSMLFLLLFLC